MEIYPGTGVPEQDTIDPVSVNGKRFVYGLADLRSVDGVQYAKRKDLGSIGPGFC